MVRDTLDAGLGEGWVVGEISNARLAPSNHLYFTLKDSRSAINVRDVQDGLPADALQSRRRDGSDRSRPRAGLRTARRVATLRRGNGTARRRRAAGRIRAVEAAARSRRTVRSRAQTRDAVHAAADRNRHGARRRGTARHAAHFVRSIPERARDFPARESAGRRLGAGDRRRDRRSQSRRPRRGADRRTRRRLARRFVGLQRRSRRPRDFPLGDSR